MAWLLLIIAGILEVLWAFTMKQSAGFSRLVPSAITIVAMIASFGLLSVSMKSLPLGTAYAVGIVVLGEQSGSVRVASAVFILIGIIGLKITSGE